MTVTLSGSMMSPPMLRFDFSSVTAQHRNARKGLRIYGPYDANILNKEGLRAAVIYQAEYEVQKNIAIEGLVRGAGTFPGFRNFFRIPISFEREVPIAQESEGELERASRMLAQEGGWDLVVMLTGSRGMPYQVIKRELLANGIPSQVISAGSLVQDSQIEWILQNVALACYAKAGGTPWVIACDHQRRELIIGISRARDRAGKLIVGFVTLFTQDGDYLFLQSSAPVLEWEQHKYVTGLSQLLVKAYEEYTHIHGKPDSLTIHFCKRYGQDREIKAVKRALAELDVSLPYALIHLNDDTNYRVFDTSHHTFVPPTGLQVDLGPRSALLLLDGLKDGRRNSRGVSRTLNIEMDRRSEVPISQFPHLVRQVYDFAHVNWRGFNSRAVPITLNYSYLIARLIVEIGANNWNELISTGRLRDKAWFL